MQFFRYKGVRFALIMTLGYMLTEHSVAMNITIVDVFTKVAGKGNPAAIVRHFRGNLQEMQSLATHLSVPATVFIETSSEPYTLRFFAPAKELPMCGHGALAAAYALLKGGAPHTSIAVRSAGAQDIALQRDSDQTYSLTLSREITPLEFLGREKEISRMLGKDYSEIKHPTFTPKIGSVGSLKLLIPVRDRSILAALTPDYDAIKKWSTQENVNGIYVYTSEVMEPSSQICARSFNPRSGQDEDAATGVAAGALAPIMHEMYGFPPEIVIEQGDFIEKPSRLHVAVEPDKVRVGGGVIFREEIIEAE